LAFSVLFSKSRNNSCHPAFARLSASCVSCFNLISSYTSFTLDGLGAIKLGMVGLVIITALKNPNILFIMYMSFLVCYFLKLPRMYVQKQYLL
jgi:hypothetical protein